MKINIERASVIEGWMTLSELTWLAENAMKHGLIVELGSYLGRSTRALADNTPGIVVAIDNWYGPNCQGDSKPLPIEKAAKESGSTGEEWTEEERAGLYAQFRENMKELIEDRKVIPVVADHDRPINIGLQPDMVFIDGEHTYEAVKRDIKTWLKELQPGGLISGHDGNLYDVKRAVKELLPNFKMAGDTTIWYAEKE